MPSVSGLELSLSTWGSYFNIFLFLCVLVIVELRNALFCTKDCQGHDQHLATASVYISFCGELIFLLTEV